MYNKVKVVDMSVDKVRKYLEQFGKENDILEFETSSATVRLAAKAVGCAESQIAKTLSFDLGDRYILIVAAGDAKIDNSKYKAIFRKKATMASADKVEEAIGHAVGGVCPFAVNEGVVVYLDLSLKRFEYVYPACGSANSAIKLTLCELELMSKYSGWIDVCKLIAEKDISNI